MKRIAILAAALAVPAVFAQTAATVVSGGPVILEGPATAPPIAGAVIAEVPAIVAPGTVVVVPSTSVLGGPPASVTTTTTPSSVTVVRHFWNVPPDINSRMDFQRWLRLL